MLMRDVLDIKLIAQLKTITRKPRVFNSVNKINDFIVPDRYVTGRKHKGGSRPSDLSTSNMLHCIESASVFGAYGLTKKVSFQRPKPRK